jgi:hypothetical protein
MLELPSASAAAARCTRSTQERHGLGGAAKLEQCRGGCVECLGEQPPGRLEVVLLLMGVAPVEELPDPLTLVHTPRLALPSRRNLAALSTTNSIAACVPTRSGFLPVFDELTDSRGWVAGCHPGGRRLATAPR